MKTSLITVAGGYSSRMGGSVRKPFLDIDGKPIFFYTLAIFSKIPFIEQIVFVVNAADLQMVNEKWGDRLKEYKVTHVVPGGKRRQDSVYNGLKQVKADCEVVLIHDCVRPFISQDLILQVINKAYEQGAAIVAVPVKDTIKESDSPNKTTVITRTVPRANLWAAQTPQGFKIGIIREAYDMLQNSDFEATDDAQVVEKCGYDVEIVRGSYKNIKITTQEDLKIAESILKQ
ncbi:MAG: 2-C-methyl-D-erythritol 4-phosphate cytidylyltransferase [Candidatus Anammoxibacter sp.]